MHVECASATATSDEACEQGPSWSRRSPAALLAVLPPPGLALLAELLLPLLLLLGHPRALRELPLLEEVAHRPAVRGEPLQLLLARGSLGGRPPGGQDRRGRDCGHGRAARGLDEPAPVGARHVDAHRALRERVIRTVSSRGTATGQVPRDPPGLRIPRRPARVVLLGMTGDRRGLQAPKADRSTARLFGTALVASSSPSISSETQPWKPALRRIPAIRG